MRKQTRNSNFATNLKNLRNCQRLTQEQLAKAIKIGRPTIGAWEEKRGEPSIDNLIIIADFFNITIDQLVGKKKPQPPQPPNDRVIRDGFIPNRRPI